MDQGGPASADAAVPAPEDAPKPDDAMPAPEEAPLPDAIEAGPGDVNALFTQDQEPAPLPSASVVINLLGALVQKGILRPEEAQAMVLQAQAEADAARAASAAAVVPDDADAVKVMHVPELVKAQMREQIKAEVMAAARKERWTGLASQPEWVKNFKPIGDFRLRYEYDSFPEGNDNTGSFPNFNTINTGVPFDVSGTVFSPQFNVDTDRQRSRLRFRWGAEIDLSEGWTSGFRIATGETNSPVSTNQSLGNARGGQGGNFSKYSLWLDRAFARYEDISHPDFSWALTLGRFENPFFSNDLVWDEDVGFDGLALNAKKVMGEVTPFVNAGAFPVFNTDLNFSTNQPSKFKSNDKWMLGGQLGLDWKINKKMTAKVSAAIYDFKNVEGQLSDPFTPLGPEDAGNTDHRRPSFAQRGNTYMALRNIVPSALNNFGTTHQYQYFGLATPFRELVLAGKLDLNHWEPCQATIYTEYVKNLAFDAVDIESKAVNNRGSGTPAAADGTGALPGKFEGGDTAWIVGLKLGRPAFEKKGDWSASMTYRYVESDALVDGFTESRFAGGGTNAKGFSLGLQYALSAKTKIGFGWWSATQIAGPPLQSDVFLFDFSAKF